MPRLRNEVTGAVMSVSDSTAELLGGEWGPVDVQESEPKEAPRRGRTRKSDSAE